MDAALPVLQYHFLITSTCKGTAKVWEGAQGLGWTASCSVTCGCQSSKALDPKLP